MLSGGIACPPASPHTGRAGHLWKHNNTRVTIVTNDLCGHVSLATPRTADVTVTKIAGLCSRPHSHVSVIFFVFLAFTVFNLRTIC